MLLRLIAFAGLHWAELLEPAAPGRAWEAVGLAVLVVLGLLGAARLRRPLRWVAAAPSRSRRSRSRCSRAASADEYLRPDRWSALLAGAGRGIDALPGMRVPYRGVDEWTRAAIGAGGTLLAVAAALLAFWPRRGRTGFPAAALLALVTLYAVPAVVLNFEGEFLRGALLALLMLAFLRLEKLRVRDAPAAGVGGRRGRDRRAARRAGARRRAIRGSTTRAGRSRRPATEGGHVQLGPRLQPAGLAARRPRAAARQGRACRPTGRRATSTLFDGRSWRQDPRQRGEDPSAQLPDSPSSRGALEPADPGHAAQPPLGHASSPPGITTVVRGEAGYPIGGGVFNAPDGLGAATPTPPRSTRRARPNASCARTPTPTTRTGCARYLAIYLPEPGRRRRPTDDERAVPLRVAWPLWGEPGAAGGRALRRASRAAAARCCATQRHARACGRSRSELKREPRRRSSTSQRVEAHLDDGFAYSEQPPPASETLDGFLFDSKIGFCQQFSGAEALLLRMGGVPARVATGFTSGSFDDKQSEFVVRDLDAHSWVEAWFPRYGWVARDPTPAAAPPRSQPGDDGAATPGGLARRAGPRRRAPERPRERQRARAGRGHELARRWSLAGVLARRAVAGALLERRRRRRLPPPAQRPMAEFERALRRARFDGGPGMTLSGIERDFSGWPGAAGYVRALREQRYSGRPAAPTAEQRRGLRAALARDAGVLRAWWALPPRRT